MDSSVFIPADGADNHSLKQCVQGFGRLLEMVETTVDLEALENHEFIIKSEFDESLRIIRKKLDKLRSEMDAEHTRVGGDLNQDTERKLFLENHRVHGWCFRLTRNVNITTNIKIYPVLTLEYRKRAVFVTRGNIRNVRHRRMESSSPLLPCKL